MIAAPVAWAVHQPLIFASLGPTIYELVEQPQQKSARTYNLIMGHVVAIAAGLFRRWVLNAWDSPKVAQAGFVAGPRIWVAVIAVTLTTFATLLLRASQPASLSTTLVISLGVQTARDAWALLAGVLIIAALGEPLRLLSAKPLAEDIPPRQTRSILRNRRNPRTAPPPARRHPDFRCIIFFVRSAFPRQASLSHQHLPYQLKPELAAAPSCRANRRSLRPAAARL